MSRTAFHFRVMWDILCLLPSITLQAHPLLTHLDFSSQNQHSRSHKTQLDVSQNNEILNLGLSLLPSHY